MFLFFSCGLLQFLVENGGLLVKSKLFSQFLRGADNLGQAGCFFRYSRELLKDKNFALKHKAQNGARSSMTRGAANQSKGVGSRLADYVSIVNLKTEVKS